VKLWLSEELKDGNNGTVQHVTVVTLLKYLVQLVRAFLLWAHISQS